MLALPLPTYAQAPEISAQAKASRSGSKIAAPRPRTRITVTPRYRGTPGYGFLPGYEPPAQKRRRAEELRATYPWYGWPGFYRGRWNGGGFGPCWTKTPIGPVWNCG